MRNPVSNNGALDSSTADLDALFSRIDNVEHLLSALAGDEVEKIDSLLRERGKLIQALAGRILPGCDMEAASLRLRASVERGSYLMRRLLLRRAQLQADFHQAGRERSVAAFASGAAGATPRVDLQG